MKNEQTSAFSPLFAGLSHPDYQQICASSRVRRIARREMLYVSGDPVRQVFLLISGTVKIVQFGINGSESILRLLSPGDVVGTVEFFAHTDHQAAAVAVRDSRAMVWDPITFGNLAEKYPILLRNALRMAAGDLRELGERFCEVANDKVSARVARQVMRLIQQAGAAGNSGTDIVLSREEVAQMTGTTLFTVSRLFSSWAAQGLVIPRREGLTVSDPESLRAIANEA